MTVRPLQRRLAAIVAAAGSSWSTAGEGEGTRATAVGVIGV